MPLPVRSLPVVQNWDCHVTGSCCKEYVITLSADEKARIEAQGWTAEELGGLPPFKHVGWPWARQAQLNDRPSDGGCVFLSPEGRCRIHERFGYDAKPLPCRLFPFVLIPAGDHWRVGLRYACPSAAANKGRALPEHHQALAAFAAGLAEREKLTPAKDGSLGAPPPQDSGARLDWPDTLRLVDALVKVLLNRKDAVERRVRKCLHLAAQMRKADLSEVRGARLGELMSLLVGAADAEVPQSPGQVAAPGWTGRVLFRQAAALFTRKDRGPNRGAAAGGTAARIAAALRFARAKGAIPRLHRLVPQATFAEAEQPRGPLPAEAEQVLERYYVIKVGSLQFCSASFGLPFWEGLQALAVTLPIVLWLARCYRDVPREQAVVNALTIVDDHVGFNRVLATFRQRLSFTILARTGELARLIAWYSR